MADTIKIQTGGRDRIWPFKSSNATLKRLEDGFRASLGLTGRLSDYKASLDATRRFTAAGVDAEDREVREAGSAAWRCKSTRRVAARSTPSLRMCFPSCDRYKQPGRQPTAP
jgi:hypothetical protein